MKNFEAYEKQIREIGMKAGIENVAFDGHNWNTCSIARCKNCIFRSGDCCGDKYINWLYSEYEEPPVDWSKVPVDTKIWVRDIDGDIWLKRHFAKYKNGKVWTYKGGQTSWTTQELDDWNFAELADGEK